MGAKSKKSSKGKDSKKSSKKSSKKPSKEKDKSKSSKSKDKSTKKSKSPKSKNDSLVVDEEDLNDKKPEIDGGIQNQNPLNFPNLNLDNKYLTTLNSNNPFMQLQNGSANPLQSPNLHPINVQNLITPQKCEGCFIADAVCFCKECGKAFCPSCDGQIHLVPIYKNHERVPINEMKHLKHLCVHHNLPLKLFCNSCNEPACDECKIIGPHDSKLHYVKNIIEAYNEKYKILLDITENRIIGDINYLIGNQNLIENKIKELENKANVIEKEINEAYYKNIEKLNSEKGKRIAILNFESAKYQKEMINIQEIINYNEEYSENNRNNISNNSKNEEEKQIEYLLKYKSIMEDIEAIISKPLNDISLEEGIDTMPLREMTEVLKMENFNKMKTMLKVKNDIIWNLILMRKKLPEKTLKKIRDKQYELKKDEEINGINTRSNFEFTNTYNKKRKSEEESERSIHNILDEIKFFIKRNNFNMFQLLSENSIDDKKDFISKNNLLSCLQNMNLNIDEEKLDKMLLKYDLIKDSDSINIDDFLKLLI